MASPAILKIDIIADATKAIKAMEDTGGAAKTTGSKFASAGKVIGGALAVGSVVAFGKASFGAAEESAQATARLEQVFSSMGDTTGEAAKAAEDYASALSAKIAVDDEAIMAAQAQLATFGAVSDETARSAGVFDRATAAAADLAAAGFGSLDANSVQLGKALQDPTKGLTALAKSGVTFTQSQKDQIAAMQESGDLLGAQKIVLEAVEGQVKGTAEATATGSDKMAIAFGEVQEQVGGFLLPAMTKLTEIFIKYKGIILPVGAALLGVVAAVKAYELGAKAVKVAQAAWNVVQIAFNLIMAANPLVLIVLGILALVAAVVLAYQKVGWFRDLVDTAFRAIKDAIAFVVDWVKANWPLLLAVLTGPIGIAVLLITQHWDTLKAAAMAVWDAIKAAFDFIKDKIQVVVDAVKLYIDAWILYFNTVKTVAGEVWDKIKEVFDWIKDKIETVIAAAKESMQGWVDLFNTVKDAVQAVWDKINDVFGWIKDKVETAVTAIKTSMQGWVDLFNTLKTTATDVKDWVVEKFQAIVDFFGGIPETIKTAFSTLGEKIQAPFKAAFNAIARAWNATVGGMGFSVPSWVPGIGGNKFEIPEMPTLMTGGVVARTGLAIVHAGEQFSGVGNRFGGGGNVTINVTTTGLGADSASIQRAVANALRGYTARNGPLDIPVRGVA